MRTARPLSHALLLAILLCAPATTLAQTGAASLTGIVTDQSGAAIPGATVTATNQATNIAYTAVSNEAGNYTITSLPVGSYVVKAELASFKTAATKPIQMEAMQIGRIDFKMEVGGVEETVVVSGESPVLQTETATVGEVISGTTLQALPLNGRNSGQLSLLLPGVVTPNPGSFTGARNTGGGGRPYVNGNREQTNNYTIDGVDMNESIDNLVAYQPSPDALAEISVETNNYSADTGNVAGAVISNVLKSGTNRFRGNVFEFYRNSRMDANSFFNNRSNAAKPERKQNIFGGTIGGPIIRNKVFFFGDYQGTRFEAPGSELASVAPESWRRGDLAGATAIRDPRTGVAFPGNQIPLSRIAPIAAGILANTNLYPLPNRAPTSGLVTNNFVGERLQTIRANQADVRVDWSVSNNDKIFGRFSYAEYEDITDKRAFPLLLGSTQDAPFRNLAFNWNRLFKSTLVNEVLVGYNQIAIVNNTLDWAGIGNGNATFGIAGGQPIAGLSSIGLGSGLTGLGAGASDSDTLDKHYQINEKLTWLKGRHSMKFGGQLIHYVQRRFYAGNNGLLGLFGYNAAFSGFAFSDFLLDQVASKGRGSQSEAWTHVHNRSALYVQDDLKVTSALTLNLGLRWAYTQPVVEKDNRQSNFDLRTGAQIFPDDSSREGRALYKAYKKGFEPRLGLAWRPDDRWVVRAAYGISQYMEGTGANLRLLRARLCRADGSPFRGVGQVLQPSECREREFRGRPHAPVARLRIVSRQRGDKRLAVPAGAKLAQRPPDFTSGGWQHAGGAFASRPLGMPGPLVDRRDGIVNAHHRREPFERVAIDDERVGQLTPGAERVRDDQLLPGRFAGSLCKGGQRFLFAAVVRLAERVPDPRICGPFRRRLFEQIDPRGVADLNGGTAPERQR